jgi:uncharacterized protein YbjT (DUF2867 family)
MNPKILVTGASGGIQGGTGNYLVRMLLEKGTPVRAFVHKEDDRSDRLREAGADIHTGDILTIQSVRKAMKGIESVYFCYPVREGLLDAAAIVAEVAREEGIKFIINLSQGSASDDSPSPRSRRHWLSERIFDWTGIPSFHLRGMVFYENLFRQFAKGIREDSELRAPFESGDAIVPAIAAQDISKLAFTALQYPPQFADKTIFAGGSALSLNQIAQELTTLLGRTIHYKKVSPEEWIKETEIREGKQNPELIHHLVNLWKNILLTNQDPGTASRLSQLSGLFQKLTGESAMTLSEWVRLNKTALEGKMTEVKV